MIYPQNTRRTMKSSCRSKTRRKSVRSNNTMHKMTSQNICRNIHPVFVVLLAVSWYEIRNQNSRIIDRIFKKTFLIHIINKNFNLDMFELSTTMWKSEPSTWVWKQGEWVGCLAVRETKGHGQHQRFGCHVW